MSRGGGRPRDIGVIDTLIGFKEVTGTERDLPQVKAPLRGTVHAADYMYRDVPPLAGEDADMVAETLAAMDANGVAVGLVSLTHPASAAAAARHPDRFVLATHVDAGDAAAPARIRAEHEALGARAVTLFPAGHIRGSAQIRGIRLVSFGP